MYSDEDSTEDFTDNKALTVQASEVSQGSNSEAEKTEETTTVSITETIEETSEEAPVDSYKYLSQSEEKEEAKIVNRIDEEQNDEAKNVDNDESRCHSEPITPKRRKQMVEQKTPIKTKPLVLPPLSPAPHLWTLTPPRTSSASKTVPPPLTPAPHLRKPALLKLALKQ